MVGGGREVLCASRESERVRAARSSRSHRAADDWTKRLAEAVDGSSEALHHALLNGHVREESGDARHREAVPDSDKGEGGREHQEVVRHREEREA